MRSRFICGILILCGGLAWAGAIWVDHLSRERAPGLAPTEGRPEVSENAQTDGGSSMLHFPSPHRSDETSPHAPDLGVSPETA